MSACRLIGVGAYCDEHGQLAERCLRALEEENERLRRDAWHWTRRSDFWLQRYTELATLADLLVKTWGDDWDCSRHPGHANTAHWVGAIETSLSKASPNEAK